MPSASRHLARAPCHGAKVAKNKPTSGHTDFVAHFTDRIDRGEDCRESSGDFCSADEC